MTPHPLARRALVLGVVGLVGFFILVVPALLSPFAWYYGAVARRESEREPGRWTSSGDATAAMVCGIVGTALLALALVAGAFVVVAMAVLTTSEGAYSS